MEDESQAILDVLCAVIEGIDITHVRQSRIAARDKAIADGLIDSYLVFYLTAKGQQFYSSQMDAKSRSEE